MASSIENMPDSSTVLDPAIGVAIIRQLMNDIRVSAGDRDTPTALWAELIAGAAAEILIEENGPEWVAAELRKYADNIESRSRPKVLN